MSLVRSLTVAVLAMSQSVWLPGAHAQLVPLGSEFQVNSYTTNNQFYPAVATDAAGNFVVVWTSNGSAGTDSDVSIQGQRYDATGAAQGGQFQVNSYTTSGQYRAAVATDAAGNFVVVWLSIGSAGTDSDVSIQGQRYDATGAAQGGEFQVNSYTTSTQQSPTVATDAAGNFVVVWESAGSAGTDTSGVSIQGQRYDATGVAQGGEFQVNSYTTNFQVDPTVATDAAGNIVVVWESAGSAGTDTDGFSVQGQRYDATGAAQGGEFQVNSYTTNYQGAPAVATDAAGNFVVVWASYGGAGTDTSNGSIQAQRYDATGAAQGGEFQVNSYTTSDQGFPAVATDAVGNFVVVWQSQGSAGTDTSDFSTQAQRYDATGAAQGGEFQVNSYTTSIQGLPAVATDAAGNFVVVWIGNGSAGTDTSSYSVQAQRFAPGRSILGKKVLVKDPTGSEDKRTVIALGKETATDIGATVLGDPTTSGATLRVITNGTTSSDQTYLLGSSGWSAAGTVGYKYSGPTDGDGDPVRKVLVKRTPSGKALVKAILKGSVGTQSLDVVPPNLGDDGGIILTIPGGGTYCATFGGAAGGTEVKDDAQLWKVTNATAQGCPTP